LSHQKPGFQLEASVTAQAGGTTEIQFTLPGGQKVAMSGPPMAADKIGPLNVMYYPDQCIQVLLVEQGGGVKRMQIPISDMPPHETTPPAPPRTPRGRPRNN
jgi:hypothetical protein